MAKRLQIRTKISGVQYIGEWKNKNIPIYDVLSADGLNGVIGYAKHTYSDDTILYRGQCKLYEHLIPSIRHDSSSFSTNNAALDDLLEKMKDDSDFNKIFAWDTMVKGWALYQKTVYEAVLQHYGAKTNSVDFVDNHWTALWFALNKYDSGSASYSKRGNSKDADEDLNIEFKPYYNWGNIAKEVIEKYKNTPVEEFLKRRKEGNKIPEAYLKLRINNESLAKDFEKRSNSANGFVFLYAADTNVSDVRGLFLGRDTFTVDLRKSVPGAFLRPAAQHGWIVRGKSVDYNFDEDVIGILRLSVDLMKQLLGDGDLLKQANFFPSPMNDVGFRHLLSFQQGTKYNISGYTLLPADTITVLHNPIP